MPFLPSAAARAELEPGGTVGGSRAGVGTGGRPQPPSSPSEPEPEGYPENETSLQKTSPVSLITSKAKPGCQGTRHSRTPRSSAVTPRRSPALGGQGLCWITRV